jgi:hypothetical protein
LRVRNLEVVFCRVVTTARDTHSEHPAATQERERPTEGGPE